MDDLHKNYIGGEWVDGDAAPNINPSNTDEIVGHYARASVDDVRNAIAAAKAAFPAWSRSGIQQRHDILKAASDEILKRREQAVAERRAATAAKAEANDTVPGSGMALKGLPT